MLTKLFLDLFQEAFPDEKLDIKIIPKNTLPNPSGMFNMYVFETEEFGKVSIVVSSKPPGGDGKGEECGGKLEQNAGASTNRPNYGADKGNHEEHRRG